MQTNRILRKCEISRLKAQPGGALRDTICRYLDGMRDFDVNAPTDDIDNSYAKKSYQPPLEELIDWTSAAETREEAMAALRLAEEEIDVMLDGGMVLPLLKAAVGYFEADAKAFPKVRPKKIFSDAYEATSGVASVCSLAQFKAWELSENLAGSGFSESIADIARVLRLAEKQLDGVIELIGQLEFEASQTIGKENFPA